MSPSRVSPRTCPAPRASARIVSAFARSKNPLVSRSCASANGSVSGGSGASTEGFGGGAISVNSESSTAGSKVKSAIGASIRCGSPKSGWMAMSPLSYWRSIASSNFCGT